MFYKRAERSFIRVKKQDKDISGGSVVKTLSSSAEGVVQSLVGERRFHMSHGQKTKT